MHTTTSCITTRRYVWPWSLLLLLVCVLGTQAFAAEAGSGELRMVDTQGHTHSFVSLDTQVHFNVHGLVAEVEVHQHFNNDSADWLEGQYLLPLPPGAAVYAMTVHIGKRTIIGQIKEKGAARKVFAQARAQGHKAALIEADGDNLFRTSVTQVAPGESVDVELHYWQRVAYRDGQFSLHFPLTYTPPYHMHAGATSQSADPGISGPQVFADAKDEPPLRTRIEVSLDAGVPLATVDSPSHAIVSRQQGDTWHVHLRDNSVLPDRDFVLQWRPQPLSQPNIASFVEHIDGSDYAMLMFMPPQQRVQSLPRELILVIDTSGSMGGASIRQARAALGMALAQLRPEDRFNVIEFNSSMRALHDSAVPATPAAVSAARQWVAQLQAGGGTEMASALQLALKGHAPPGFVRQVVFATDGAVDNPGGLMHIIDTQLGDSRLFPIGIGSAPNAGFMKHAAQHGRGSVTLIPDLHDVNSAMRGLLARLDHPALSNIHIDWPHGADAYPRQLPDLYLGEPLLVTARLDQPGGRVQVSGDMADHTWTDPVQLGSASQAQGLGRLWAQASIDDLEAQLVRGGDMATLRPQIVKTALKAHLVSRFTSLVAVDKTPSREGDTSVHKVQVANVMPAGTVFAQTATPARLYLLLALLLAILGGWMWRREA